jgi:hypothetical protein
MELKDNICYLTRLWLDGGVHGLHYKSQQKTLSLVLAM